MPRSLPLPSTCLYSFPLFLSLTLPFSRSVSHSSSSVSPLFSLKYPKLSATTRLFVSSTRRRRRRCCSFRDSPPLTMSRRQYVSPTLNLGFSYARVYESRCHPRDSTSLIHWTAHSPLQEGPPSSLFPLAPLTVSFITVAFSPFWSLYLSSSICTFVVFGFRYPV